MQAGGTADLKVEMRNITLGSLLPKGARTILNEKSIFETETTQLTWESTDPELTWKLAGHASFPKQAGNPPLRIQSISLIPLLSRLTNSELAESLEADLCGLDFSVTPTGCTLENINMVANAKFRLLGSLRLLADGSLDGKLKLGIAPDLMVTSEAPPFFAKGQDGYFWADVSLSGPVGAPVDDLSERITKWLSDMGETAPGGKSLPEPGEPGATRSPPSEGKPTPETPAKNAEDLFRSLTEKPDAAGAKPRPKSQGP